jgi:hypothetical protein
VAADEQAFRIGPTSRPPTTESTTQAMIASVRMMSQCGMGHNTMVVDLATEWLDIGDVADGTCR